MKKRIIKFKITASSIVFIILLASTISGISITEKCSGLTNIQNVNVADSYSLSENNVDTDSINKSSLIQMEIFNPEDINAHDFMLLHNWEVNTILIVLKTEDGKRYLNNSEVQEIISWAHQNNLFIYGLIDTLKDINYSRIFPERTQINLVSNNSSEYISPLNNDYKLLLEGFVSEAAALFDGIVFSNLRYKSESFDFSNKMISQFIRENTDVNWTSLEIAFLTIYRSQSNMMLIPVKDENILEKETQEQ